MFTDVAGSCPYIRDVLEFGMRGASDNDIAIYINQDVCARSDCALLIASVMQDTDACYSHRRDFNQDFHAPKPDSEIEKGDDYIGADLFAFRVSWWKEHRAMLPDLLLGREFWDCALRHIMDATTPPGKALLHNMIYHRRHASTWERAENRHALPSQWYCIKLAWLFCSKYGIDGREAGLP